MASTRSPHRVVIVGGGAAGLELATRLARDVGRRRDVDITLVDATLSHLWKPLLHEVAAGSLNSHEDDVNYVVHAHWHGFRFRLGRLAGVDRAGRRIALAPALDRDGSEINAPRELAYDTLVIAVGSVANDFGTTGVQQHCYFLDSREDADRFHRDLLHRCYLANSRATPPETGELHVAIAGGGATGVELAAELHDSFRLMIEHGLEHIVPDRDLQIHLIEGADRLLPGLPERISRQTRELLESMGVRVHTGELVTEATEAGIQTRSGRFIPAAIKVWAAGIKAPELLAAIDGLETNARNQLVVTPELATTRDPDIYAIGDCAACADGDRGLVPPRAQAAHQQATHLARNIRYRLDGRVQKPYRYVDYGSLVNLSTGGAVGTLMGNLLGKRSTRLFVEGALARFTYVSLYKLHQVAVLGWVRTALLTLANWLTRPARPRLKLH